jgi:hypothetical protein
MMVQQQNSTQKFKDCITRLTNNLHYLQNQSGILDEHSNHLRTIQRSRALDRFLYGVTFSAWGRWQFECNDVDLVEKNLCGFRNNLKEALRLLERFSAQELYDHLLNNQGNWNVLNAAITFNCTQLQGKKPALNIQRDVWRDLCFIDPDFSSSYRSYRFCENYFSDAQTMQDQIGEPITIIIGALNIQDKNNWPAIAEVITDLKLNKCLDFMQKDLPVLQDLLCFKIQKLDPNLPFEGKHYDAMKSSWQADELGLHILDLLVDRPDNTGFHAFVTHHTLLSDIIDDPVVLQAIAERPGHYQQHFAMVRSTLKAAHSSGEDNPNNSVDKCGRNLYQGFWYRGACYWAGVIAGVSGLVGMAFFVAAAKIAMLLHISPAAFGSVTLAGVVCSYPALIFVGAALLFCLLGLCCSVLSKQKFLSAAQVVALDLQLCKGEGVDSASYSQQMSVSPQAQYVSHVPPPGGRREQLVAPEDKQDPTIVSADEVVGVRASVEQ